MCASKVGGEILNVWYWVAVRDCCIVQVPVVTEKSSTSYNLRHHVEQ